MGFSVDPHIAHCTLYVVIRGTHAADNIEGPAENDRNAEGHEQRNQRQEYKTNEKSTALGANVAPITMNNQVIRSACATSSRHSDNLLLKLRR